MLGSAVHDVLEKIVKRAVQNLPADLENALRIEATAVPWPSGKESDAIIRDAARRTIRDAGIGLFEMEKVLELNMRPVIERAKQLDWDDPGSPVNVLAAEVLGKIEMMDPEGRGREIFFKADRVDRMNAEKGEIRFTDYKTGKPICELKTEKNRREHLLKGIERGERLQAAAYVLGAGPGTPASGRYLFLKPNAPDYATTFAVSTDDGDMIDAFHEAVRAVLGAWDWGCFFPRIVKNDLKNEPDRCRRCEVAEACIRGDSGHRTRLTRWIERMNDPEREPADRSLFDEKMLDLWGIGDRREDTDE